MDRAQSQATIGRRPTRKVATDMAVSISTRGCDHADNFGFYLCPKHRGMCEGRKLFWSKKSLFTKMEWDKRTFLQSGKDVPLGTGGTMEEIVLSIAEQLFQEEIA